MRVLFILVALAILGALHYWIWRRLVRDPAWPAPWRQIATTTVFVAGSIGPVSFLLWRIFGWKSVSEILYWPAMIWLGLMFLIVVFLIPTELGRLATWIVGKLRGLPPPDPERRVFLARAVGGTVAALAGGAGAYAMTAALGPVRVVDVRVPLARLPRELDGTTIVQLTDMHVGPTIGRAFVEDVVRRVNALSPDVVAITGDMVDGSVDDLRDAIAPLADLKARYGTYFVTGNHEYYSGVDDWLAHLPTLGVNVLANRRVSIGNGAASFDLAGIHDPTARQTATPPDLAAALAGRDPSRELVLLAHQPRQVREASRLGVGLQLSGHTHGGQIWPWRYLVYLQQPFVAGLGKYGSTWIYTSCGTGYWGPPMRLGAPAEITRVTLEAKAG